MNGPRLLGFAGKDDGRTKINVSLIRFGYVIPNLDTWSLWLTGLTHDSTNVEIKDATVTISDDCISIVSNSSKVTVTRIACDPGHEISLGKSGTCDQVYDRSIHEAFLSNAKSGLRIKTWQEGTGFVRNVEYENVWMMNVSHPIIFDQYYCESSKAYPIKVRITQRPILFWHEAAG
uniref:Probable polygalacturonase At1g80170 n=1 Tax=Tanacetum cinerariifolium TaxID=118510 RepID=A0A6L2M9G2_TANCI|nr:probable polygalacturonase At1g80170 [Tanacetum cinerariifolium]